MNHNSKCVLKIASALLLLCIGIALVCYLFVYDKGKAQLYQPQLNYRFLQTQMERIHPVSEDLSDEITVTQTGFKGILSYSCTKSTVDEIKEDFQYLSRNEYEGTHITFPDDSYEIYVGLARYTPIIDAWRYGWWDYEGNIYAQKNGKTAAEGKPNYRNYFHYTIRKKDVKISLAIYCNTDDAEKALAAAIECLNR